MGKFYDITGQKFGKLTVIKRDGVDGTISTWLCECECGKQAVVRKSHLTTGETSSCGCLRFERDDSYFRPTHGMTNAPEHRIWKGIIGRCTNPRSHNYAYYGARGITVCKGWRRFENFIADMGKKTSPKHSIDRINNDDGYHCGHCEDCKANGWVANCRWATWKEQANNKRK